MGSSTWVIPCGLSCGPCACWMTFCLLKVKCSPWTLGGSVGEPEVPIVHTQMLGALSKLGLQTEVTPGALLEAAQSLHDTAEPAEEHISRAGALLHQLNILACQGMPSGQWFPTQCAVAVVMAQHE
jgi:hypothetical protein